MQTNIFATTAKFWQLCHNSQSPQSYGGLKLHTYALISQKVIYSALIFSWNKVVVMTMFKHVWFLASNFSCWRYNWCRQYRAVQILIQPISRVSWPPSCQQLLSFDWPPGSPTNLWRKTLFDMIFHLPGKTNLLKIKYEINQLCLLREISGIFWYLSRRMKKRKRTKDGGRVKRKMSFVLL